MERPLLFRRPIGRPKGRPADPSAAARVAVLLDGLPRTPDLLIEALHRVQDAEGHLSAAMIVAIAGDFRMSQAEVRSTPPPTQAPCTAAMTGIRARSRQENVSCSDSR